jgi:hypothetical protein
MIFLETAEERCVPRTIRGYRGCWHFYNNKSSILSRLRCAQAKLQMYLSSSVQIWIEMDYVTRFIPGDELSVRARTMAAVGVVCKSEGAAGATQRWFPFLVLPSPNLRYGRNYYIGLAKFIPFLLWILWMCISFFILDIVRSCVYVQTILYAQHIQCSAFAL